MIDTTFPIELTFVYAELNLIAFIALLAFVLYSARDFKWTRGKFPQNLSFTKDNLTLAYMAMTTGFIFLDRRYEAVKKKMLRQFIARKYKAMPKRFDHYLELFLDRPMHPVSVATWISKHAKQGTKDELVEFLVRLCMVDGTFNKREYDALRIIARQFSIDPNKLDRWIEMNRTHKQTSGRSSQQQHAQQRATVTTSLRAQHARVLGVSENANPQEIKARYRALAKMYHPDRFSRESKETQEEAHTRFLEIQKAYEFFQN